MDEDIVFNPGPMPQAGGRPAPEQQRPSAPAPADQDEIIFNPTAPPAPQKSALDQYRADIAARPAAERDAMVRRQQAAHAKFERENGPTMSGLATGLTQAGDIFSYGALPYAAAAMQYPFSDKSYADRVTDIKNMQYRSAKEHPYESGAGTAAGLVGGLLSGSTEAKLGKSLAQGSFYGLTQGGSGLEDLISGKGGIVNPLIQTGTGAALAYPAHMLGQAINPEVVKDAAKYAYKLGVKLPAGIMSAGQKGYEHLADAASETAFGVRQKFDDIAGGFDAVPAAQKAINNFMIYTGGRIPPDLASTFNYFSKTLSEAPETAMQAIINSPPEALAAMKYTLQRNGANDVWEGLQNGFMQHLAGPQGKFNFGEFSQRLGATPKKTQQILLDGYDQGQKLLGDVGNLAQSTMHKTGVNLIDAASQNLKFAQKEGSRVRNWLKNTALNPFTYYSLYQIPLTAATAAKALAVAPALAAGYAAKKGADAAGRAMSKRNVATSPKVSNAVNSATKAATRYATSQAGSAADTVAEYTQEPLRNMVNTFASPEAAKWYSENMPAILGGKADGGRVAYKAGGKVNGIEPLVLALMNKAKMAKKTSNKATEPLLNERDDAIANALAVAQKAI
jgi:hypothetical protein